jgi:hypothetical protein
MATFSQGFLANLGRPAMTESLFDLGTAIGGLPGQYKEAQKKDELDKLFKTINAARIQQDTEALTNAVKQLQALGYRKEASALIPEIIEGNTLTARRLKVGNLARKLNAPAELIESIGTMQLDELLDTAKALRVRGLENIPTGNLATRLATAESVGIGKDRFEALDLGTLPDKAFNDFISGQGGELEFFVKDGEVEAFRTKNGLIWSEEETKWLEPQGLGLSKPPELSRVESITNKFAEDLGGIGSKEFAEQYDSAKKNRDALEGILRSKPNIDNMFTGALANTKVEIFKIAEAFGIPLGDIDEKITNNELYAAEAGKRVAAYITNLGAGTGLSDEDRKYAEKVTAGLATYSSAALKELLGRMEQGARRSIKEYEDSYQRVKSKLEGDQMGALAFFPETFSIEEPEISVDPSLGPAAQKLLLEAQQQIDAQAASSQ